MLNDNPQDYANDFVAKAYDVGINYYDISPLYGNAQEKLGPALKPYRNKCFLACKTQEREVQKSNWKNRCRFSERIILIFTSCML